ncbi:peptidase S8 [Dokdonia pacifica]|uniref:Subtilase family protein n=1 Tax=Dokdonia pacifica TaxID=1627892 RepID=A0A239DL68_9FLAO|nr:S8 family serine peptidase [Dokdonia pacifica]GGG36965.1 peptidase S8 [Dokdonia pacifica]SNS33167.1 Subtilase family protein [Dokdonia pacifica]
MKIGVILVFFLIVSSSQAQQKKSIITWDKIKKEISLLEQREKKWYHQDIIKDSVPGTSLFRTYDELLKHKKSEEVIVAVLDMSVDIHHKYLKSNIWINPNEIANNNIDDDGNGYVDDLNGWNFLGNQRGENLTYEQFEFVRIIKMLDNSKTPLTKADSLLLTKVKTVYKSYLKEANDNLINTNMVIESRTNAEIFLKNIFGNREYTIKDIDSLKKSFPNDTLLQTHARRMSNFITYGFTPERNEERKNDILNSIKFMLNKDYPERIIIGDFEQTKLYSNYGNNNVDTHFSFLSHGTLTSGFLTTKYIDKDSVNIFKNIKIMPLRVSAYGSEHDKDIALAIRYAVDHGARVINMSFGKRFSMNKEWVDDAIKYAENKDVLIVKSAGNDQFNTDILENTKYPNDYNNGIEFSDNYITVGGTSYGLNEKLLYNRSNYGKETVDIFAPGYGLIGLRPNDNVATNLKGTSFSASIVSGVAALIRSYYPSLTAAEVKQILMDSSVKYDILVDVPTKENPDQQLPFSELSKSGGIVNAYNAMLMAEEYIRKKKK